MLLLMVVTPPQTYGVKMTDLWSVLILTIYHTMWLFYLTLEMEKYRDRIPKQRRD